MPSSTCPPHDNVYARSAIAAIVALTLIAITPAGVPAGGPFTVTRGDDPEPNQCLASDCSLREAIIAANGNPGGDTVVVPAGVYTLSIPRAVMPFDNSPLRGDVEVTEELTLIGAGADTTFLDAGGVDRVLQINGNFSVTIADLTIRNGMSDEGGGAILNALADLTLTDVALVDNLSGGGGALYNLQFGSVSMTRVTVERNTAEGGFGNGGGVLNIAQDVLTVVDSSIADNIALLSGGGIYTNSEVNLEQTIVSGNSAGTNGGGIATFGEFASLNLSNTTVTDNQAGGDGGGVDIGAADTDGQVAAIVASTIADNQAAGDGGGIDTGAPTTIESSTINGNSALNGGGVRNASTTDAINSTISGNQAGSSGGGILNTGTGSELSLTHVTVASNQAGGAPLGSITSAPGAGGVHVQSGLVTSASTIFASNGGLNCAFDPSSSMHDNGYSIEDGLNCDLGTPSADPLLEPLAYNGGPTQTHALQPGSPAIDAILADCDSNIDQRGAPRPFDGDGTGPAYCDVGAYEYGSAVPTPTPTPEPGAPALWADHDCDGAVAATDALKALQHLAALPYQQSDPCFGFGDPVSVSPAALGGLLWGDVDCDQDLDAADALGVLLSIAASPVNQQPGCPEIGASILVAPWPS